MRLELVAVNPRKPSTPKGIESRLSNPGSYLHFAVQATAAAKESELQKFHPDEFLADFKQTLDSARFCLDRISESLGQSGNARVEFESRVRLRDLLDQLSNWVVRAVIDRNPPEGFPSEALIVAPGVQEATVELAKLGRRLGVAWRELESSGLVDASESLFRISKRRNKKDRGPARRRGRPQRGNPREDEKIASQWQESGCNTYAEFQQKCGIDAKETRKAVDRHRKRKARRNK